MLNSLWLCPEGIPVPVNGLFTHIRTIISTFSGHIIDAVSHWEISKTSHSTLLPLSSLKYIPVFLKCVSLFLEKYTVTMAQKESKFNLRGKSPNDTVERVDLSALSMLFVCVLVHFLCANNKK